MFSVDGIYGSGLRSGFANTGNLPFYIQVDTAIKKAFVVPTVGKMEARIAVVNLFDRHLSGPQRHWNRSLRQSVRPAPGALWRNQMGVAVHATAARCINKCTLRSAH